LAGRLVQLLDLGGDVAQRGERVGPLAEQDDALHAVVLVLPDDVAGGVAGLAALLVVPRAAEAHPAEARLAADDYALPASRRPVADRASLDHVIDADRHVVHRSDHDLADLADAALLLLAEHAGRLGRVVQAEDAQHRVLAAAEQADAADHLDRAPLLQVVAA